MPWNGIYVETIADAWSQLKKTNVILKVVDAGLADEHKSTNETSLFELCSRS